MLTKKQYAEAAQRAAAALAEAGIILTEDEKKRIEVADFGLSDLENIGLQIITYINTDRVCAKEMVMFPFQTCPEHTHADGADYQGKQETFRCRRGLVYLYTSGEPTEKIGAGLPATETTVSHETVLRPGEQYTMYPNTPHWFQAGPEGAIVSEFSTRSRDESDIFTDRRIKRLPEVE